MERLKATEICIAVWEDGSMRIVLSQNDAVKTIDDGSTLYSPLDMFHYVQLEPHERRMLHEFKKRFGVGGTSEWK